MALPPTLGRQFLLMRSKLPQSKKFAWFSGLFHPKEGHLRREDTDPIDGNKHEGGMTEENLRYTEGAKPKD